MAGSYDETLSNLPKFNRRQLEEIRRRCAFLLQQKSTKHETLEDEDWILEGILIEIRRRGLGPPPGFRIQRHSSYANFSTQSANVRELLVKTISNLTATERRFFGEVAAKELARYIHWKDISLNVLLENVSLVPQALEKAFPGYLTSGMMGVMLRHMRD
jgi:hypothetical protein